ncbi:hypothetical protein [Sphaerisporangium dianthi]|uniref:Uncharacterized protein n=1 Tax=Sphaerisporangium dianthi TaxID=1436120 RepID=A0ABV9CAF6_9ACTN
MSLHRMALPCALTDESAPCFQNRISYVFDGLETPTLPVGINAEVAAERVAKSRLRDKRYSVTTTTAEALTDTERAALTWLLAGFCGPDQAASEFRQIFPLAGGPGAAVGQVILSYDQDLNGRAVLVGRGLPLGGPADASSKETLAQTLKNTYSLGEIRGPWTAGELLKVSRALALTSATDREALVGVELERVTNLADKPELAEENFHTQAQFFHMVGPNSGRWGVIYVADRAFVNDAVGFFGGTDGVPARPPSFEVILHEVGHAIETAVRRADSRANALGVLASVSPTVHQRTAVLPQDDITAATNMKFKDLKRWESVTDDAKTAYEAVANKAANADQLIGEWRGKMPDYAQALQAMKEGSGAGAATTIRKKLLSEWSSMVDVMEFIGELIITLKGPKAAGLKAENFTTIEQERLPELKHAPWLDFHDEVLRFCTVQRPAALWRAKYYRAGKKTTGREQEFTKYVNAKGIKIDLTPYTARMNSGTELYAESYGIWRVHPQALATHNADLFTYFNDGHYLQGD